MNCCSRHGKYGSEFRKARLEKLMVRLLVRNFPSFMQFECYLLCRHELETGRYI
jgi:hypothetical protein